VPIIGRLLAEWTGQIGCLFLMSMWNPALLAEQVGTLASMATRRTGQSRHCFQPGITEFVDIFGSCDVSVGALAC